MPTLIDDFPANASTTAGAIEFDGDVDRIKVTQAVGQSYSITMTGAGDQFDVDVSDGHGVRLNYGYGYGYASPSGGGTVIVAPTTSGDYYIDIAHQQTTTLRTVLPYTLTLTGAAIDLVGNTPATAVPLALGAVVKGTLETGSDVDVYKVSLAAGVTYALALPAGMPYSLLTLSGADDAGASAAGARALTLGGHADGILESGADRDWFAIALTAGSTVWFTLTSSANFSTGGQLRLFDANGALLDATAAATDFAFAVTLPYLVATSGTYYIEAASMQAKAGAYTIAAAIGVPDDIGGTRASATLLTPGAALTGTIELVSDIDMFKFAVVAGQTYDIALTASQASTVTLSDAQGAPVATLSRIAGGTGALFTATTTGTVYASVNSQFHGSAAPTYTIRETVYARDNVAGDSSSTGVLQIGAGLRGAINYPGDHDLLRVSLEAGKSYVFQLLGAGTGGGDLLTSGAFFLWLRGASSYDSGAAVKAIAGGVESRFAVTPAQSGDYFLDVGSNVSPIVGSYAVKAVLLSGDASAPAVVGQSHTAGTRDMALGAGPISFTFNEAITIDKVAITLKDSGGQNVILAYGAGADGPFASVSDGTLTLTPSTALLPGSYTISLPHAGVHDLAGNQYTGPETFTFSTLLPRAAGGAGNDLIAGGTGAIIDGGAGLDTVYYGGFDVNYTVTRAGTTLSVVDRLSGVTDTLVNVERLTMRSWTFAYDLDGDAGQAYRLYQAAFHRTPDVVGLGFWIGQRDKGAALLDIAAGFVNSAEFAALYGTAPTDTAYVDALYANVLHRSPDAAGYAYWSAAMHNGGSRADMLMQFSESAENKAALVGVIGDHFAYIAY
jgi:hypothetical protein